MVLLLVEYLWSHSYSLRQSQELLNGAVACRIRSHSRDNVPPDVSKAGTKIMSIHPMLQIHNPEHINFTGLRMAMEWPLNRHGRFLAVNI